MFNNETVPMNNQGRVVGGVLNPLQATNPPQTGGSNPQVQQGLEQPKTGTAIPDASLVKEITLYYKMEGNTMTFKLKDYINQEKYTIWDNNVKHFYKEGEQITDAADRMQQVNNTKWMKKEDFDLAFPNCMRRTLHDRKILIVQPEGLCEYNYGFKPTQNKKLEEAIKLLRSTGIDPLTKTFKMTRHGDGLGTSYEMEIVPEQNMPSAVTNITTLTNDKYGRQATITPAQVNNENPPTPQEMNLYNQLESTPGFDKVSWIQGYLSNCDGTNVVGDTKRAEHIWNEIVNNQTKGV